MAAHIEPLPWQRQQWAYAAGRLAAQRMPHALLLTGVAGCGQEQFAQALVAAALCLQRNEDGLACGHCSACELYKAGTHPDFQGIAAEAGSEQIKIDQIRELLSFLGLSRQFAGYRVALIEAADRLNPNAANSLLKMLEEPPAASLLVLVATQPALLPITIRSRCQRLRFGVPPNDEGLKWLAAKLGDEAKAKQLLAFAQGAPVRALALYEQDALQRWTQWRASLSALLTGHAEALQVAEAWSKADLEEMLNWWLGICSAMIKWQLHALDQKLLADDDALPRLADNVDSARALAFFDKLLSACRWARTGVNNALLLEDLLLDWQQLLKTESRA